MFQGWSCQINEHDMLIWWFPLFALGEVSILELQDIYHILRKKNPIPLYIALNSLLHWKKNMWFESVAFGNEGLNQRNLKIWADVADKICFGCT